MSVQDRVLNALTGFILLDVFKMVSDIACSSRNLPRGTLFLACETYRNLQHVALGLVAYCLCKDSEQDPWSRGHQRLTELGVEEWFGRIRLQSSNAQHSARSFFKASAREMLRAAKSSPKPPQPHVQKQLAPISDSDFVKASEKALQSAIHLVGFCSGYDRDSLEKKYRDWCVSGQFLQSDPLMGDEDEFQDDVGDEVRPTEDPAPALLKHMQDEANMDSELDIQVPDRVEIDLRNVQDKAELLETFKAGMDQVEPDEDDATNHHATPKNLHHALWCLGPGDSAVAVYDRLWRLLMALRHWGGGGDQHWVRNPRASRRKSQSLNWYQFLAHICPNHPKYRVPGAYRFERMVSCDLSC